MTGHLWVEKDVILLKQNKTFCFCKLFKININLYEKKLHTNELQKNPTKHFDLIHYIKTYVKFIDL